MFYEKEFSVPYPLPKQGILYSNLFVCASMYVLPHVYTPLYLLSDLFAIPDFSAGAMENWGLITYRETALLYDEETDPATSKQRVAVVIAHELAHQVRSPE